MTSGVPQTLVDVAVSAKLTTLVDLVVKTKLVDAVKGSGLTLFAPTNEAFQNLEKMFPGVLTYLSQHPQVLINILKYHIVPGKQVAQVFVNAVRGNAKTLEGSPIRFVYYKKAKLLRLNGYVTVKKADVLTANGSVAHVIDHVLIPDHLVPIIEKEVLG
jgi:transforming growth factor-beta-induced protein